MFTSIPTLRSVQDWTRSLMSIAWICRKDKDTPPEISSFELGWKLGTGWNSVEVMTLTFGRWKRGTYMGNRSAAVFNGFGWARNVWAPLWRFFFGKSTQYFNFHMLEERTKPGKLGISRALLTVPHARGTICTREQIIYTLRVKLVRFNLISQGDQAMRARAQNTDPSVSFKNTGYKEHTTGFSLQRDAEEHVSESMSPILTSFKNLVRLKNYWIVTGTLTTNVLGLDFGEGWTICNSSCRVTMKGTRGKALSSLHPFSLNLDGGALATHVILQEPTMLNRTQSIPYRVFEARQLLSIQQTARLGQTNFWKDLLKESKQDYILVICSSLRGDELDEFSLAVLSHTELSGLGETHLMSKPDNTRDSVPFIVVRSWKPCNPDLGNSVPGAVFIFSLIPRNGYITRILLEHARPLI
ncbi:hypothetical protein EDD18DRAFT_1339886 [Armillaria luteobubalina]|uniref:Uncharacterized protein n=1 Tax=Armillaria luteobubalina TaxID=153913 RepID=A0AA39NY16_9AGAR|nr:hypothetical protein EDD18DRAFT_1339886 [Armillaria luteobubalina]